MHRIQEIKQFLEKAMFRARLGLDTLTHGDGIFYNQTLSEWENKMHRHYTALHEWTAEATAEVSTSSTDWTTLIETISKSYETAYLLLFIFTHNVKNMGTLASRGADFKIVGHDDIGEFDINGALFRWTDGLADYKQMSVIFVIYVGSMTEMQFKVQWKVDDASYPCFSKNRFFAIKTWVQGAGIAGVY